MSPEATPDRPRRAVCTRCERPESVCYCHALVSLETRSRVVILQHPRERGMPVGTAHMATLCLPSASLHVGMDWDGGDVLRDACADPERPPVLLFPGPDARDVLDEPPEHPVTLVVVDGTWSQAKGMLLNNPELASLPRVAFRAPEPSNYRVRMPPRPEVVSTLEALMHVLGALERDPERFRALRRPMDAMVDAHLAQAERRPCPRKARVRRRLAPFERLPAAIRECPEHLVLVFGDANAWPCDTPERDLGDELVYWVAHRPATSETFASVIAPRLPLAPDAPRHTGLPREALLAGVSPESTLASFDDFLRPDDVLCSWGHHGLRMFRDMGGVLRHRFLDLRGAARVLTNTKNGPLELYAQETAIETAFVPPPGRAGARLAMIEGIVAAWRRLPTE